MVDTKCQSPLAEATADMVRACAVAAARIASTPMSESMSFWARMVRASAAIQVTPFCGVWVTPFGRSVIPANSGMPAKPAVPHPSESAVGTAFSSYRSSGGHAVAQVIVPAE